MVSATCLHSRNMSATALRMPLRTSQDAPRFCGDANDLSRYIAEVESLCQTRQHAADAELIKWACYYTDKKSWDTWTAIRDALASPASWLDFKAAIHDMYPVHEAAHAPMPLPASLLPSATVPCALPPAAPIVESLPAALPVPLLPADPICVPLLPPSPSTAALPVPPTEPQLLPVPRSPLRFPAEQWPSLDRKSVV